MPNANEREYKTRITAVGKAKIAAVIQGGGNVNVTQVAVGDGGGAYYFPTADMTALRGEVWRGDIAGKWINEESANMVVVRAILPADVGGFTAREAALFDADGDMIAICNMPDTEKAVITTGAAADLTIEMNILLTDTDAVEFTINPFLDVVTAADVERMIRQHKSTFSREIIIPTDGWNVGTNQGLSGVCIDLPQADITENMIPIISIYPGSLQIAKESGLSPVCQTIDGALLLYAEKEPAEEIRANLTLLMASYGAASGGGGSESYVLQPARPNRLGGVKIGGGIDYTDDGTISVDGEKLMDATIASDEDVNAVLESVFAGDEG